MMQLNIALLSKHFKSEICDIMKKVIAELERYECNILMSSFSSKYFSGAKIIYLGDIDALIEKSDMVFVVGGDGTIIHYAKESAKYGKPVFGINGGNLGFLSVCDKNEMSKIREIMEGDYSVNERIMLDVEFAGNRFMALNDVVVGRNADASVLRYSVSKNGKLVCNYTADGVIFATPTGSTAYSLSAGGPIADRNLECMLLTPICAHTLSARSMVLDIDSEALLGIKGSGNKNDKFFVSIDGEKAEQNLSENRNIKITKSKFKAKFIEPASYSFYDKVRKKLTVDLSINM